LPDTLANWPWPRTLNPHYEVVKAETDAWFRSFNALSPKALLAFEKCDFSRAAALAYPFYSRDHLRTASDIMAFAFFVDDYNDKLSKSEAQGIVDIIIDALRHTDRPRPADEPVFGEMAKQFWSLAVNTTSPVTQRRFIIAFKEYLDATVQQAADRENNANHTVDSYLQNRRKDIGARPFFTLLELGLDVPEDVLDSKVVKELQIYASDMLILDNDVFSYIKEQAVGDPHNILTVLKRQLNLDLEDGLKWVAESHSSVQRKFLDKLHTLEPQGSEVDNDVRRYIDGIAYWVRANESWSFECARYFGDNGREYQRTRLVPLLLTKESHAETVEVTLREESVAPIAKESEVAEVAGVAQSAAMFG